VFHSLLTVRIEKLLAKVAHNGVHYRRWGFDVGQARIVKLHIDLKMKLHKKLKKDCPARTNAE
jgi:hypothetical protein